MPTTTRKKPTVQVSATTATVAAKSRSLAAKKAAKTRKANAAKAASANGGQGGGGAGVGSGGAMGQQNLSAPPFAIPQGSLGQVNQREITVMQKAVQNYMQQAIANAIAGFSTHVACSFLQQGDSYTAQRWQTITSEYLAQHGLVAAGS